MNLEFFPLSAPSSVCSLTPRYRHPAPVRSDSRARASVAGAWESTLWRGHDELTCERVLVVPDDGLRRAFGRRGRRSHPASRSLRGARDGNGSSSSSSSHTGASTRTGRARRGRSGGCCWVAGDEHEGRKWPAGTSRVRVARCAGARRSGASATRSELGRARQSTRYGTRARRRSLRGSNERASCPRACWSTCRWTALAAHLRLLSDLVNTVLFRERTRELRPGPAPSLCLRMFYV